GLPRDGQAVLEVDARILDVDRDVTRHEVVIAEIGDEAGRDAVVVLLHLECTHAPRLWEVQTASGGRMPEVPVASAASVPRCTMRLSASTCTIEGWNSRASAGSICA